jgi:hypothetical protein
MKEQKLSTGENVVFDVINPIFIHHVDINFNEDERKSMIDAIDIMCNPELGMNRKSEDEMIASYGNLLSLSNENIERAKKAFIEITANIMRERVGNEMFEKNFFIHDILAYGTFMTANGSDSPVRHNYPWTFSSILFVKSPKGVKQGDAAVLFINPTVSDEHAENYGVLPIENHMIVFPGHILVKDRSFRHENLEEYRVTLNMNIKYLPKNLSQLQEESKTMRTVGEGISEEQYQKMIKSKKNDW